MLYLLQSALSRNACYVKGWCSDLPGSSINTLTLDTSSIITLLPPAAQTLLTTSWSRQPGPQ